MIKGAFVILADYDNNVLLQHRDNMAPSNPNMWALWGGAIENGETPEKAAIRELKEELGIDFNPSNLKFLADYNDYNKDSSGNMSRIFVLNIENNLEFHLGEGDNLKFFNKQEIKDLNLEPITRRALSKYFS